MDIKTVDDANLHQDTHLRLRSPDAGEPLWMVDMLWLRSLPLDGCDWRLTAA